MSDGESAEEFDDMSWNPELQRVYADDSWGTEDVEIDEDADNIAWKNNLGIKMMNYPEMLLELFDEEKTEIQLNLRYPKKSALSRSEMERYVKLEQSFKSTQSISELERKKFKNFKDFKLLRSKVLNEQEEYQRFLMDMSPALIPRYNHISPGAEKWFERRMEAAAAHVKKYKQLYVHLRDFGIVFVPFKNDSSPCRIENLIKHLGNKKPLARVSEKTKIPSTISYKAYCLDSRNSNKQWKKCVVSEDINAERLAIAWNADIVIGMGALQTLADNLPPYSSEWEIPVIVQMFEGLAYSKRHKIAFIDKPLPPRRIAPREKNQIFFKKIFKQVSHKNMAGQKCSNSARQPSDRRFGQDETCSDDVIAQFDGANDEEYDKSSKKCVGCSSISIAKTLQRSSCQCYGDQVVESTQHVMRLTAGDFIMQVDGASDDSQDIENTRTGNDVPKRKTKIAGSSNKTAWLKPREPSVSRTVKTLSLHSSEVEPFSGKKSTRSWAQTEEKSSSVRTSEADKTKSSKSINTTEASTELSFRLLPESALSIPLNPPKKSSKSCKVAVKNDIDGVEFTPRRSARTKVARSDSQAVAKTKIATPNQRNLRKRRCKKAVVLSQDMASSDDEPLIEITKKSQLKIPSDKVKQEKSEKILDDHKNKETYDESSARNSMISENDVLGQILGAEPRLAPTIKDISSVWASQAEKMKHTDVDNSYSTNDLGLLQPDVNDNVSYSLWKLGKKRVLVRYTLDGCLVPPIPPNVGKRSVDFHSQQPSDVSLRTKLEYQSEVVFERLTQSELCRDYVTMLFKRPAKIVRARIDPLKNEVLDVEWTMTLNHFQDKAAMVGYNPAVTTKLLTKVFEMIGDLDKGEYICAHRENEQKMSVRKSVDVAGKNVVYDLHKEYCNPGRGVVYTQAAPWVPADVNKLRKLRSGWPIIPLMFDPKEGAGGKSTSRKSQKK